MKFLIDAQLSPSLKKLFISRGYDCVHTLDLENQNDTQGHNNRSIRDVHEYFNVHQ